jgi:hypothetical protein
MGRLAALAMALASILHAPGAMWPGPSGARAPDTGSGPPPAWVETHTRSLWLAQSSYCWRSGSRGICGDFPPPQYRTGIPTLRVHRGATVRIHFGFTPRSVSLSAPGPAVRLRAARVVEWRPAGSGLVSIFVLAARGDASYVVRVNLV